MAEERNFHCNFTDKDVRAVVLPTGKEVCKKVADCMLVTTCSHVLTFLNLSSIELSLLPTREIFITA